MVDWPSTSNQEFRDRSILDCVHEISLEEKVISIDICFKIYFDHG